VGVHVYTPSYQEAEVGESLSKAGLRKRVRAYLNKQLNQERARGVNKVPSARP
jgi:hypothetical protein